MRAHFETPFPKAPYNSVIHFEFKEQLIRKLKFGTTQQVFVTFRASLHCVTLFPTRPTKLGSFPLDKTLCKIRIHSRFSCNLHSTWTMWVAEENVQKNQWVRVEKETDRNWRGLVVGAYLFVYLGVLTRGTRCAGYFTVVPLDRLTRWRTRSLMLVALRDNCHPLSVDLPLIDDAIAVRKDALCCVVGLTLGETKNRLFFGLSRGHYLSELD